jgi:hypothetical protein
MELSADAGLNLTVLHRAAALGRHRVGGAGEVEEVGAFGVVELEPPGERFEHAVGDAADVPALQALVIVDADAGQRCDLFTAKARDTPLAVGRQTRLLRCDLRSPGGQELRDVVRRVHVDQRTSIRATERCPVSTRFAGPL